ncbi:hypothetical protein M1432_02755 [Patescibacteria group bacterium]|nr:hypothetical protein [Patescibacteria group bacterium]
MFNEKAQVALPFILIVSGVIVEIVIASSFVAYFLSNSGLGARLQTQAQVAADAGIWDALSRISGNKDFTTSQTVYGLASGSGSATVTVTRTTVNTNGTYVYTVQSLGTAGTREKYVVATAVVDQVTGQMQVQSINEQAVQ